MSAPLKAHINLSKAGWFVNGEAEGYDSLTTCVKSDRGWNRQFEDPIPLARGRQLVTLKDAADYITKLPKAEHDRAHD